MSHPQDQAVRDIAHTEAPVSRRSYFICAFASFGGILLGYDSGYINGVLGMVRNNLLVTKWEQAADEYLRPMLSEPWVTLFPSLKITQAVMP